MTNIRVALSNLAAASGRLAYAALDFARTAKVVGNVTETTSEHHKALMDAAMAFADAKLAVVRLEKEESA